MLEDRHANTNMNKWSMTHWHQSNEDAKVKGHATGGARSRSSTDSWELDAVLAAESIF